MQSIVTAIQSRIFGHGRGWVFTPRDFLDLGDFRTVSVSLGRLAARGGIKRLTRGIYIYPKKHHALGDLLPTTQQVAEAIAERDHLRILASGAYAANQLGLTEQVPAKVVFLTDGKNRKIAIGKTTLEFRKASPRNMALAGKRSGIVVQALRYMGKQHVNKQMIETLRDLLPSSVRRELLRHISVAPVWMRQHILAIARV